MKILSLCMYGMTQASILCYSLSQGNISKQLFSGSLTDQDLFIRH